MQYCYFGNTTLKTGKLLLNIETQLILFKELFNSANEDDVWTNNSDLQFRYQELLIQHDLLKTNDHATGSKNASAKSAPLEDYGLINRKKKEITPLGEELLELLKQEKFHEYNNFLQIDLVSLFFFKATLNATKESNHIEGVLLKYLEVFKYFDGSLTKEQFYLLPTICNFTSTHDFIEKLKSSGFTSLGFLSELLYQDEKLQERRANFLRAVEVDDFTDPEYFRSAKGMSAAKIVMKMYKILISVRNNAYKEDDLKNLFKTNINGKSNHYKKLYLSYLFDGKMTITKENEEKHYKKLIAFAQEGTYEAFTNRFFDLIYSSRALNNLEDYFQLNRYYLYLTGIFEFKPDAVSVTESVDVILQHSEYKAILTTIASQKVSITSLDHLLDDAQVQRSLVKYGITSTDDLKDYKYNQDKKKLQTLLDTDFSKENIINAILPLFKTRQDRDINTLVSAFATIPTIFEYIIAISWYYIDNKNIDFILNAGLSLDSNMLPKSHAVGGNSDFEIKYSDHTLMIEVTLTEHTNQRRAEMESVSRHLGNILLNIKDPTLRANSYGIFISTHLDKNVLNDFRVRQMAYWENSTDHIKGMNILPLDTDDIISILRSQRDYEALRPHFYELIQHDEERGSKWYSNYIKPYMQSLSVDNR